MFVTSALSLWAYLLSEQPSVRPAVIVEAAFCPANVYAMNGSPENCVTIVLLAGLAFTATEVGISCLLRLCLSHVAICSTGCMHGTCALPGTCTCNTGYSGALCDTRL
jgi:hypothetical protein